MPSASTAGRPRGRRRRFSGRPPSTSPSRTAPSGSLAPRTRRTAASLAYTARSTAQGWCDGPAGTDGSRVVADRHLHRRTRSVCGWRASGSTAAARRSRSSSIGTAGTGPRARCRRCPTAAHCPTSRRSARRSRLAVGFGADLVGQHAVAYTWTPRTRWRLDLATADRVLGTDRRLVGAGLTRPGRSAGCRPQTATGRCSSAGRHLVARARPSPAAARSCSPASPSCPRAAPGRSGSARWQGSISGDRGSLGRAQLDLDPGLTVTATGGSILRGVAIIDGNVTAVGMSRGTPSLQGLDADRRPADRHDVVGARRRRGHHGR